MKSYRMRLLSLGLILWSTTTSFAVVLPESEAAATQLHRRKATDPFIDCFGWVPSRYSGWPSGLAREMYKSVKSVCAASAGMPRNVGCTCESQADVVKCEDERQDIGLAGMEVTNYMTGLQVKMTEFCKSHCFCNAQTPRQHAAGDTSEDESETGRLFSFEHMADIDPSSGSGSELNFEPEDGHLDWNEWSSPSTHRQNGENAPAPPLNTADLPGTCGRSASCSSSRDCAAKGRARRPASGQCRCRTTSSTYNPGIGVTSFVASCLTLAIPAKASLGGKRSLETLPCVCNATYVSQQCCTSENGLVWEPPNLNLGIVTPS